MHVSWHLASDAQSSSQRGDADAVALNGAAAALLRSDRLRPRVIASLRAASSGFRQLCEDYEVSFPPTTYRAHKCCWRKRLDVAAKC